jgi:hypothetical protein
MSGGQVFFHDLFKTPPGAVKPNRSSVLRATKDYPDLSVGQALPTSEPQHFLFVVREPRECSENGMESLPPFDRLLAFGDSRLLPTHPFTHGQAPTLRATLIRD